jgi:hypothetical protein
MLTSANISKLPVLAHLKERQVENKNLPLKHALKNDRQFQFSFRVMSAMRKVYGYKWIMLVS